MSPKPQRTIPLVLTAAALAAFAWLGWRDGGWFRTAEVSAVKGARIERTRLDVNVVQRGNLSARNAVKIYSELEGRNAILELADEGTLVKPGDLLVKLDSSALQDRKVAQDIAVQNARAALTKSEQNLQIQQSQNASDVALAEQKLDFARTDLRKYLEGDWPKKLREAEEAIVLANTELSQAADRLTWSKRLLDEEFLTRTEFETDQLAHERSKIKLEQASRTKDLLERFDHPKEQKRLQAAVAEAERELERVKLQASARLVDLTADVNTNTAKYALEQEKYAKILDQIGKATIYSPVDGVVVYRRSEGGMGRSNEMIQKGTEVQERQEIMSIPQSGGMVAEASLHESVVQRVQPGMRVRLKVDAIKEREYTGEVAFVAVVPDSNSWWSNPNLRQFKTTISVLDASPDMKPGMSCNVEIQVDSVENALVAPVQAIYRSGGKNVCFVDGATREVKVGRSSEAWVEILEGLREGETVALAPPSGFKPEPEPDAPPPEGMPAGARMGSPPAAPSGAGAPSAPAASGAAGAEHEPRSAGSEAGHGGRQ